MISIDTAVFENRQVKLSLTGWLRRAGTVALAFSVVTALLLAWVPIYVSGVVSGEPSIVEQRPAGAPSGPYEPMRIDIRAEVAGTELVLPTPVLNALGERAGWSRNLAQPSRAVSRAPGDVLRIQGAFAALDLAFATGPKAGRVELGLSGTNPVTIDLDALRPGSRTFTINSGQRRTSVSGRFVWASQDLSFGQPVHRIEAVTLGSLPLSYRPLLSADGRITGVGISLVAVLQAVAGMAWRSLPLALVGAVAIAVGLGFGTLLEVLFRRRSPLSWAFPERLATGLAGAFSFLGAFNYYLPVSLITPVVLVLGLMGLVIESRRERVPKWRLDHEGTVLTSVAMAFVALPFIVTDRWAIGFLQTDVHDTFNLAQLFWHKSALGMHTDFGNGFRLLDYSVRAAVAGWARPGDAVVILRLLSTVVVFPLLWTLAVRLCHRRLMRWAFATGLGFSAAHLSLYAEGYMTRDFFATWMLLGFVLLAIALHDRRTERGDWVPAAMAFTVAAAVVPPYFVAVFAAPLAVVLLRLWWRQPLHTLATTYGKPALVAAAVFTVAVVPNLVWLRNAGDAQRYIPALNALVRVTVVPFYASMTFPATLSGVLPFHGNGAHLMGVPSGLVAPEPALALGRFLERPWVTSVVLTLLVITLCASVVAALSRRPRDASSVAFDAAWIATLAVIVSGFVCLWLMQWNDQTYFVLMWAWTLAPLTVLLAGVSMARAASAPHQLLRWVAAAGLLLLTVLNLNSAVIEGSRWLENPHGSIASRWHFDLVSDLVPFSRSLDDGTLPPQSRFQAIQQLSALTGSDDDRILANTLVGLLTTHGHRCVNCRRTRDTFNLLLNDDQVDVRVATLIIGGRTCPGPTLYLGERFVVCSPVR